MSYAIKDDLSAAVAVADEKDVPKGWYYADSLAELDFPDTRQDVERRRLLAYADPISGSDRFMVEYQAEMLAGNDLAAAEAKAKWLARREQIATENPYPQGQK